MSVVLIQLVLLLVVVSFFQSQLVCWLLNDNFEYLNFFYGFSLIAIISFLDDLCNVKQLYRLFFHILSVSFLFFQLNLFFIPIWLSIFIFIIVIGWINAFNFMDGINAISVFYAGISFLTFIYPRFSKSPINYRIHGHSFSCFWIF